MSRIPTRDQVPQISHGSPPSGPRQRPPAGGQSGFTGRDALRVLRQRWLLILLSLVICSVLAGAGTFLWLHFAPSYTATAFIQVSPPRTGDLTDTQRLYSEAIMDRLVQDAAAVVKTEPVLQEALKDERITRTSWYRGIGARGDDVRELSDAISVGTIPNTNYIRVSMRGLHRTDLPGIVNAVCEAFVADSDAQVSGTRQEQIRNLQAERSDLAEELERTSARIDRLLQDAEIPDIAERRTTIGMRLEGYIRQMIQLDMELAEAEDAMEALREQAEEGEVGGNPQIAYAVRQDPTMRQLRNMEMNLTSEIQRMKRTFGPEHPRIAEMEGNLEALREQMEHYRAMLIQEETEVMIAANMSEVSRLRAQLMKVREQYNDAERSMRDVQARLTQIEELRKRRENVERNIERIDQSLVELRLLARGDYRVRLRQRATEPRRPSMPQWHIMMPVGVLLGLTIGLGGAFLLEFIDTSVKSPGDISRRVELPVLGMIPHLEDTEEEISDLRLAFRTHPYSLVGESFRQIRTCLQFSGPASQRRSLLVTSALPGDGRTAVTLNLAAAIARGGRRVLVVDANFRQPAVKALFPDAPEEGLSSAVVGQANWADCVYEVEENFHVMPAGHMPPNPAELLGSDEMRQLLSEMENEYDQVLIDGAPCLVVTDPCVLASLTDGVILVVRAGTNTYGIVQRTRDMLNRVGARVVGVALDGVRATAGGYFRRNYETFYEYHQPQQLPPSSS